MVNFGHLDKSGENFVSLDNFMNFEGIENFACGEEKEYEKFLNSYENFGVWEDPRVLLSVIEKIGLCIYKDRKI